MICARPANPTEAWVITYRVRTPIPSLCYHTRQPSALSHNQPLLCRHTDVTDSYCGRSDASKIYLSSSPGETVTAVEDCQCAECAHLAFGESSKYPLSLAHKIRLYRIGGSKVGDSVRCICQQIPAAQCRDKLSSLLQVFPMHVLCHASIPCARMSCVCAPWQALKAKI